MPYNDLCPKGTPSGCVATAMSQIMNHFKYPSYGKGAFSYVSRANRYKLSYDFEATHFDWDNICDDYKFVYSQENAKAVADLMYACGVSVSMDYTSKGSGAYDCDVPYAMINHFGYNKSVSDHKKEYYNNNEWNEMIYDELSSGRPILYCGVDSREGGHAFVVDGIDGNGRVHVNWGWDGNSNGYFEINALNPKQFNFSTKESMVIHISPDYEGDDEDVFYANKFTVNNNGGLTMLGGGGKDTEYKCTIDSPFCLSNKTSSTVGNARMNGYIGVALYSSDYKLIAILDSTDAKNYECAVDLKNVVFTLPKSIVPTDGETYYLAPIVKNRGTECVTRIRTKEGRTDFYMVKSNENPQPGDEPGDEPGESPDDGLDYGSIFQDDFEYNVLSTKWIQENESGNMKWKLQKNSHTEDTPKEPLAQSGSSYLCLGRTDMFSLSRTQTRLYTNSSVNENSKYSLVFYHRGYSESEGGNESIEIQVKDRGERVWKSLVTIPVKNSTKWQRVEVPIENVKASSIGFLGSIQSKSLIFIDNVMLLKSDVSDDMKESTIDKSKKDVYNLQGMKVDPSVLVTSPGLYIIDGKKISTKNGNAYKIVVK